jgi:hypothetical protein
MKRFGEKMLKEYDCECKTQPCKQEQKNYCIVEIDDKMRLGWNQDVLIKWCVEALNMMIEQWNTKFSTSKI